MADDSEYIQEPFEFHAYDAPKGMHYYHLDELTGEQQRKLNSHKLDIIRNNHIYLKEHPEVRLITTTLLQGVLRARPKHNVQKFLAKHLMESWPELVRGVDEIIDNRELKAALAKQHLITFDYLSNMYDEEGVEEEKTDNEKESTPVEIKVSEEKVELTVRQICRDILEEIILNLETRDKHQVIAVHSRVAFTDSDFHLEMTGVLDFDFED